MQFGSRDVCVRALCARAVCVLKSWAEKYKAHTFVCAGPTRGAAEITLNKGHSHLVQRVLRAVSTSLCYLWALLVPLIVERRRVEPAPELRGGRACLP